MVVQLPGYRDDNESVDTNEAEQDGIQVSYHAYIISKVRIQNYIVVLQELKCERKISGFQQNIYCLCRKPYNPSQ